MMVITAAQVEGKSRSVSSGKLGRAAYTALIGRLVSCGGALPVALAFIKLGANAPTVL
jgi:hypothetical protein